MLAGRTVGPLCTQKGLAVVSSETQEGENPLLAFACDSLETSPKTWEKERCGAVGREEGTLAQWKDVKVTRSPENQAHLARNRKEIPRGTEFKGCRRPPPTFTNTHTSGVVPCS